MSTASATIGTAPPVYSNKKPFPARHTANLKLTGGASERIRVITRFRSKVPALIMLRETLSGWS
jgi:hypothetical protein